MFAAPSASNAPPNVRAANLNETAAPLRLAVGVVSRAAVDAACDVAGFFGRRVYLVASRAQVGSFPSRPGYVSGWCMEDLISYLQKKGCRSRAIVVRDHGGPLQHPEDGSAAQLSEAMNHACEALARDVKAGADGINLDVSAWRAAGGPADDGLRRLVEACEGAADGRILQYEIGIDPQSGVIADPGDIEAQLRSLHVSVPSTSVPPFVVVQFGTLVVEDRNVGALNGPGDQNARLVAQAAETARQGGALPKAHNCDYLSPWALSTLGRAGVYCNIAPQYAVTQNRLIARLLALFGDDAMRARASDAVRANGGWRRWTAEREPSGARVIELGAHYAMSDETIRGDLARIERSAHNANLPAFDEMAHKVLRQLLLQHATTLEGVSAPCQLPASRPG